MRVKTGSGQGVTLSLIGTDDDSFVENPAVPPVSNPVSCALWLQSFFIRIAVRQIENNMKMEARKRMEFRFKGSGRETTSWRTCPIDQVPEEDIRS